MVLDLPRELYSGSVPYQDVNFTLYVHHPTVDLEAGIAGYIVHVLLYKRFQLTL
jgi:hypothetical protein